MIPATRSDPVPGRQVDRHGVADLPALAGGLGAGDQQAVVTGLQAPRLPRSIATTWLNCSRVEGGDEDLLAVHLRAAEPERDGVGDPGTSAIWGAIAAENGDWTALETT